MTQKGHFIALLWTPSRRRVKLSLSRDPDKAGRWIGESLESSADLSGRVVGRGVKVERQPSQGGQRGAFATVFYAIIQDEGKGSRLVGHFQLHPVGRLFVIAWVGLSTLLAIALLVAGAMRATPESTAADAIPFLAPVVLPLLGLALAYWLRRRGRPDETAIRSWLDSLSDNSRE